MLLFLSVGCCLAALGAAEVRPTGMASAYTSSVSGSTAGRTGAYWNLQQNAAGEYEGYASSGGAPPPLKPYDSDSTVVYDKGVGDSGYRKSPAAGADTSDKAPRFVGQDKSCLRATDFSSAMDECLANPAQCSLTNGDEVRSTGLSVSMWLNLPQSFDTQPQYVLHTGGDEFGSPGVAVYYVGSADGQRYSHSIVFLVSTGAKFWKVTITGMTRPFAWNNVAFRWSPVSESVQGGPPIGLQIFVNNTLVATKRYETVNLGTEMPTKSSSDLTLTLGCKLDGTQAMRGKVDNLAAWYWYFTNNDFNTSQYFTGGLAFDMPPGATGISAEKGDHASGSAALMDPTFVPWQWEEERQRLQRQARDDMRYVSDTTPAVEGDCLLDDPLSWGAGGDDGKPHPVDCADTRIELQTALELDTQYSGFELVKAIVRVANKAGPAGLSLDDIQYLWRVGVTAAKAKLLDPYLTSVDPANNGRTYFNLLVVLSRLQEIMYDTIWRDEIITKKNPGYINYLAVMDNFLLTLADKFLITGSEGIREVMMGSNHTAAVLMKGRVADFETLGQRGFVFPHYSKEKMKKNISVPYYDFPITFKHTWGRTRDFISVAKKVILESFIDQTTDVLLIAKLHNRMHKNMPANIDQRVSGVSGAKFTVNSRIVSLIVSPGLKDEKLVENPIDVMLQHERKQYDAPYRKAAVLCVHWAFKNGSDYGGAWDTYGCTMHMTNDTHTHCRCSHLSDFALLLEDFEPSGVMPDAMYFICYILYIIGIILLIYFMFMVLFSDRLHYEIHIIHWNVAMAMCLAIVCYLLTLVAYKERVACIVVSVFVHYFYTAAYLWLTITAHYTFRAITSGQMGGRVLSVYSYAGWLLPAVVVAVLCLLDISRYGVGDRCLGAHNDYFLWVYIGIFIIMCLAVVPFILISFMNLNKESIKDPLDRQDIQWNLIGQAVLFPVVFLTWLFAVFIYLVPLGVPFLDWLFELFNSLQAILVFIFFALLIPSFRKSMRTCGRDGARDDAEKQRKQNRKKMFVPYYNMN